MSRIVDMDSTAFDLIKILMYFGYLGWSGTRIPLENVLQARRRADNPPLTIYVHVKEGIALVKRQRAYETRCKALSPQLALELVEALEAVGGVGIVRKDFDPFTAWSSVATFTNLA
ncbi:unnamed protein product [Peniophora sp. CBMAI 1063]|nr:unnamed protein product [Peniophora sp. CBMAI 1063]